MTCLEQYYNRKIIKKAEHTFHLQKLKDFPRFSWFVASYYGAALSL